MHRFYRFIIDHRKIVLALFLLASLLCLFLRKFVSVNYDMNDYLPSDSPSTVSLEVIESEFDGGIPNARIMVKGVTIPEALVYKEKFESVEGVTSVSWLDDAVSIYVPLSMSDSDTVRSFYRDETALFTVCIDDKYRVSAVNEIRKIIGEENAMTGNAVSTAMGTTSTVSEVRKISVIGILFALFVLVMTTSSWAAPFIILFGMGIAVAINVGTNLIFGEISFVTNAAGNILQLAVSLDYSVFLIHRFEESRKMITDNKDAMTDALGKSAGAIFSSGLTTVIGFMALTLMRFKIGPDLGLALAKGIAISLITVFIFMPALILSLCGLLNKTKHKKLLPEFTVFGKFVHRIFLPLIILFFILIIPAYLASNANDFYFGSSHLFGASTQYGRDTKEIEEMFGENDTYVLAVPSGDMAIQKKLSSELHSLSDVTSIISYVDTVGAEIPPEFLDEETKRMLESENYSRMVLTVSVPYEGDETFDLVRNIREIADKYYSESYYLAGQGVSTYDLKDTVVSDMPKVNIVAVAAVFFVLLLSLRSFALPVILVLGIETAIWLNLSVPYFMNNTVFYIAYLIISSVQLGATVDYAILMTERYCENREKSNKRDAFVKTISQVSLSILTSGSVLTVVGLLMGYFSTNQLLSQLGVFIGRGAVFSLIIVLFVLPGLLSFFDRILLFGNIRKFKRDRERK